MGRLQSQILTIRRAIDALQHHKSWHGSYSCPTGNDRLDYGLPQATEGERYSMISSIEVHLDLCSTRMNGKFSVGWR
jgi:hypothetical protein